MPDKPSVEIGFLDATHTTSGPVMIALMFDEADVAMWCRLLGQAARENHPEKLAGILALIESAARAEREELQRRSGANRRRGRRRTTSGVQNRHTWSTLLATEEGSIPLGSNPTRNSELYLRYLRLADCALNGETASFDTVTAAHHKKKKHAA